MGSINLNINYSLIFKSVTPFIFIIVFAYLVTLVMYIYLPKEKASILERTTSALQYKRYDIKDAFMKEEIKKIIKKKVIPKKQDYQFLSNINLLAIFHIGRDGGFVTVQERGKTTTQILAIGETIKGYTLKKVFFNYAIFVKNSKEYRLSLRGDDKKLKFEVVRNQSSQQQRNDNIKQIDEDKIAVKRNHINSYIKDVSKIWKDISIRENLSKGMIDGFKIEHVRRNSDFEKLGLQDNDIIKSINNIELRSYNDAFKLYNQFNNTKRLNIKILRNNKEVEINYEIE